MTLRNLGVVFDPVLNMSGQISSVVKCVHFHLRNLSRIRRFIDQDTCKLAVQALVFSRIDYGNALLLGATDFDLTRLQRLQNRAARLIFLVGRDTSSAPLLRRLHWLPIRKRIEFKILVIIYKCVNSQVHIQMCQWNEIAIWAISFHFASQRMPLAHHMTVHFFPFQELGHVRQIMRFKSLVHFCGILFQPTWDSICVKIVAII